MGIVSRIYRRIFPPKIPTHPFDLRHGVDTSGLLYADKLSSGHSHDRHNTAYWGTAPSLLRGAVTRWQKTLPVTPYALQDYTFVDIGCGKGRVVLLASEYPFLQVVGVELNPALAAIAERNVLRWQRSEHPCQHLAILHADVLAVPIPDTPVLLYLFNPFDAHVMQLLLDRLSTLAVTRSAPIDLIYTRPEHAALFTLIPSTRLLDRAEIPLTAEDTAADAFATRTQNYCLYRMQLAGSHSAQA